MSPVVAFVVWTFVLAVWIAFAIWFEATGKRNTRADDFAGGILVGLMVTAVLVTVFDVTWQAVTR